MGSNVDAAADPLAGSTGDSPPALGGEMATLVREFDWGATPIGPASSWPKSLRTMVGVVLANPFPMLIWWGDELRHLYNDAYRPMLGAKHPASLGQPASDVWAEIWDIVGPRALRVLSGGEATFDEDLHLPVDRYGYVEETYFTFSYSPIPDTGRPSGVGGVLVTVTETTARVIGERRVRALRDLGARAADAKKAEEACTIAAETLETHARDLPFSLIYLMDDTTPRLTASAGTMRGSVDVLHTADDVPGVSPEIRAVAAEVLRTGRAQTVEGIGHVRHRPGPWPEAPHTAIVVPIPSPVQDQPAGILIAGVSPRLALDEAYRGFVELVASQVGIAITNARAYEEERRRAEALAELDRAKTLFFSNVSHEFRTPLTLLLGPAEGILNDPALAPEHRAQVQVIHRNALRLLKLVNTLLDFSRIESGRIAATFEPTDLATYTAELASNFRAAIEAAGMRFVVDASPLREPVYVDRDMWEKVVLNLLSNAFKHTFAGEIAVRVRSGGGGAQVTVTDTGVGIAADELPRIFQRFHRVANARSRTHEGTGIGLALVQELVRYHGGRIDVESVEGAGTTFTVSLPFGAAHLPRDRVHTTAGHRHPRPPTLGASPYVEEALRWLPDSATQRTDTTRTRPVAAAGTSLDPPPRVLVADDNSDMRQYVVRLLEAEGWTVEAVTDGLAALDAARAHAPDLVLSDVMMPGLNGFALLRELRADARTNALPVILLSARAGEEARVEGASSGADDYLVKPFSAQELVARVGAHVRLARIRADAEAVLRQRTAQFETLLNVAPLGVVLVDADFRIRIVNPIGLPAFGGIPELIGRDFDEVMHLIWSKDYADEIVSLFRHTLRTGEPYSTPERIEQRRDRDVTEYYEWQINRTVLPDGGYGVVCYFRDISAQVQARLAVEDARRQAEDAKRVAESANSAKSEFLTAMSHELRTPLNAIAGYAQLMEMGVHGPITDAQHEALARIQRSEAHLLALINDVLNFAKLEAGRVVYAEEDVPIAGVIADVVSMVEPQLVAKRLGIEQRVPGGLVARADNEKVRQVLLNLLSNAVKFTHAGGSVTIDALPNDQDGDAGHSGAVRVRVADTGPGIAAEKLEAIFEPFVQLRGTGGSTGGGTGLGLAISRDLARGMGGDLTVCSTEGVGSAFTLTLPASGHTA